MILITFEFLEKAHNFPKLQGCGSKIEPAMPLWMSEFKRAWHAQFLSHTYETLEKYVFFKGLYMVLLPFFEIHGGIWDKDFVHRCHIHILSHPCLSACIFEQSEKNSIISSGWIWSNSKHPNMSRYRVQTARERIRRDCYLYNTAIVSY